MLRYKNLAVIGTSHISRQSVAEITKFISEENPEVVAVELDKQRLYSLLHNVKSKLSLRDISVIGFKGFLFAALAGYLQKKLANVVKIEPGADMKAAAVLAMKNKLKLALIDQDIRVTLKKFSRKLSWAERFRFVGDIFGSIFFRKKLMEKFGVVNLDLRKVPEVELIRKLMNEMKERYPNVYSVLVAERNVIMANRLITLMKAEPDSLILATVGAGHAEEMVEIIKEKVPSA